MEVNRDFSRVRHGVRNQMALCQVLRNSSRATEHEEALRQLTALEGEEDELKYLSESVKAKSSNLRMTSSDIRLLSNNADALMKLGPISPQQEIVRQTNPREQPIVEQVSVRESTVIENSTSLVGSAVEATQPTTIVEAESNEPDVLDIDSLLEQM